MKDRLHLRYKLNKGGGAKSASGIERNTLHGIDILEFHWYAFSTLCGQQGSRSGKPRPLHVL